MRDVVVVTPNKVQFKDFVKKYKDIYVKTSKTANTYEQYGVRYLWCCRAFTLRGRNLSHDAVLVKIGAWYELPTQEIEDIENQFKIRFGRA